jgi:argininosuccinate lyase
MKLWSGRFSGSLDEIAAKLNNSLPFDQRLALVDVRGSIAWAKAIGRAGVIPAEDALIIVAGLEQIRGEFESGVFSFDEGDEDIHTAVERRLTEIAGPVGGKLHTGRSRNDQVATDFRLWMLDELEAMDGHKRGLQATLLSRAERDMGTIMPGYTHTQQAQPILISHWWLSHFWALQRDRQRLADLAKRTSFCPLGSAALAGTAFQVDRAALAADLGMAGPSPNSLDAISDRDFAAEFLFAAALCASHLSRLADALILFSTVEFGFVTLSDAYSTGSSLMPQKRNPDTLELARAKGGVLLGVLTGFMAALKGLPSAYDKDLQEDKPAVFDAADTLALVLQVVRGAVDTLQVNAEKMRASLGWGMQATDLADYLVRRGVPFREAHHAAGSAVKRSEQLAIALPDLPLSEWQSIHPAFGEDLFAAFNMDHTISLRAAIGGTAPAAVKQQMEQAKKALDDLHMIY